MCLIALPCMYSDGVAGHIRDVYADFNELTLQITLKALFGCSLDDDDGDVNTVRTHLDDDSGGGSNKSRGVHVGGSADAAAIVGAVEKAFEFFTRRAGAGMMLPEWLPTWDNLEFGAAVAQLDKVGCIQVHCDFSDAALHHL